MRRGTWNNFHTCCRPTHLPIAASVGINQLVVPTSWLSTIGSRAFPVTGPQTWNDLPEDMTSAESFDIRCILKTHLFRKSLPDYLLDINWLSTVLLLRPPKKFWLIDWLIFFWLIVNTWQEVINLLQQWVPWNSTHREFMCKPECVVGQASLIIRSSLTHYRTDLH